MDLAARMIIDENVNKEGDPSTSDDDIYLDEEENFIYINWE